MGGRAPRGTSEAGAEAAGGFAVVGADALGGAVLAAGRDVGAAEDRLVAAGVLGVAPQRAPAQRGLVRGRAARARLRRLVRGDGRGVELAAVEVVVPRDVAGEL